MSRFWIAVASKEHVLRGVAEGFCQVCHGKSGPLKRLNEGDSIIYYSPTEKFGEKRAYRKFTALGKIEPGEAYQHEMAPDFIPWRKNVHFYSVKDVAIEPILNQLTFIKDISKWGYMFRFGLFEIPEQDFQLIAHLMTNKDES